MNRFVWVALVAALLAGCGAQPADKDAPLSFQRLDGRDTTGLSQGPGLLREFEVVRDPAGGLRARGRLDLPEETRLDLIVYAVPGLQVVARTQFALHGAGFETPPVFGASGPLPRGTYRFQLRGQFDPDLQPAQVMAALEGGRKLRGPGVIRVGSGNFAFVHDQEFRR